MPENDKSASDEAYRYTYYTWGSGIWFIDQIIEYLTQSGVMDGGLLCGQPFII